MVKTWLRASLVALALVLVLSTPGFSQSQATTGVISGTVVDQSDAVLPGASVAILNTATNFGKTETTDSGGRFRAILLPLGPYRITVTLPGFATLVRDGINLSVGQEVNLKLPLQLSGVQQEIRVTGEAPVVETSRTAGSTLIDDEAVQNLPNADSQFPGLHEADARRDDRPGPRRGRALDQRPEGNPQQRLGGRPGLQQPLLRRAARRAAPAFHVQPRRRAGGRRRRRRGAGGVRPFFRRLRQRHHEVRHERVPRLGPRLLQGRQPVSESGEAEILGRRDRREVRALAVAGGIHARRADLRRTGSSTSSAPTRSRATRRSRPIPRGSSRGSSITSTRSEFPTRTVRSTGPTTRSSVSSSSTGTPRTSTWRRCATRIRGLNRRTGPSTSTPGASARTRPRRTVLLDRGLAHLDPDEQSPERAPRSVLPGGPAAPLSRPDRDLDGPPAAGHRVRLRAQLPVRDAVLHPGRVLRHPDPAPR